jgi:selenocysteine-specific elongation factor
LQEAATFGVSLGRWAQAEGLAELPDVASAAYGGWSVGATQRESLADAAIAALRSFHAREPDMLGPDAARLRRAALPRLPEAVWAAVLAGLVDDGRVAMRGPFVHLPAHGLELSAIDRRIAQKIAPALAAAGFEGAWARDLAKDNRESEAVMRATLARLGQRGEVHQVVNDLCYAPQVIARLATIARTLAADDADIVTVARFRDAAGLGRKRAVQLLEYFDRIGLLRRVGDTHRLRADSTLYAGGAGG